MKNKNRFIPLLLDTEKESNFQIGLQPNGIYKYCNKGINSLGIGQPKHLYILDTETEIKEGDWCINKNRDTLYQIKTGLASDNDWNKVIATTDDSLLWIEDKEAMVKSSKYPSDFNKIQPDFIKQLISKFNNKEDVIIHVEMERYDNGNSIMDSSIAYLKPKLIDNYIVISFVEELTLDIITAWESLPEGNHDVATVQNWLTNKMKPAIDRIRKQSKTYNREKVIGLLKKVHYLGHGTTVSKSTEILNNFIKDNL